ncbi:MAG: hypothetical protein HC880_14985 [Bacteroidia bacterium]|nr:hypothetical protein [Bacteroidia bacterium]
MKIEDKTEICRLGLIFTLVFCLNNLAWGQQDETPKVEMSGDCTLVLSEPVFSPSVAALYSTVLPGMGQAYNRRYWKMPIIYGLGATLGYFMKWNNVRYVLAKNAVLAKLENRDDADPLPRLSVDAARRGRDYYKRNRDMMIILAVLLHGLQVVEAAVDAHLKGFDVGDKLSFSIEPFTDQHLGQSWAGLSFRLRF